MDALNFLKHQHREVEALFGKLAQSTHADERRSVFEKIDKNLRLHSTLEEELFYPQLRLRAEKSAERLEVAQAFEEHALLKIEIESIEPLDADKEAFEAKTNVLKDLVQHHVDEEESAIFKIAHHVFTKEELDELGDRLRELRRRQALPSHCVCVESVFGGWDSAALCRPSVWPRKGQSQSPAYGFLLFYRFDPI